ncbi:hypothetical protein [Agromyces sp. NPDC055658]
MCGQFTLKERPAELAAALGALAGDSSNWRPSFSIPPKSTIPVFVEAKLPTPSSLVDARGPSATDSHGRSRDLWGWWLDPSLVGDHALVDEAVKAALRLAEQLDVYTVRPSRVGQDGPTLIDPVDA